MDRAPFREALSRTFEGRSARRSLAMALVENGAQSRFSGLTHRLLMPLTAPAVMVKR